MATLDKEMAEERVLVLLQIDFKPLIKTNKFSLLVSFLQLESLQLENEQMKDKLEEVTLDLEILKNEVSEGGRTIFQWNVYNIFKINKLLLTEHVLESDGKVINQIS